MSTEDSMVGRVTPDSAIVGDIVRLSNDQEGRVVAARPAGNNFVDVQLEDGLTWVTDNYEIVQRAPHPAVSDAVASAHLSGVDGPADHVETLEAVARGEVTADDAVEALVDDHLRATLALARHNADCRCEDRDLPIHGHPHRRQWYADADAALALLTPALRKAYLDGHDAGYAHAKVSDPWAKKPALEEYRVQTAKDLLALAEAAVEPAGNALVDLAEARRLLRERNRAYGRASATIGVLRGALARSQAARTWLTRDLTATSTERAAWANKAERLRAERDEAREYVARLVLETTGSWSSWESWRGQPDTEATEQAPALVDAIIQRAVARCADMDGVSVDTCGVDRLARYRDYVTATLAELPMDVLGQLSVDGTQ